MITIVLYLTICVLNVSCDDKKADELYSDYEELANILGFKKPIKHLEEIKHVNEPITKQILSNPNQHNIDKLDNFKYFNIKRNQFRHPLKKYKYVIISKRKSEDVDDEIADDDDDDDEEDEDQEEDVALEEVTEDPTTTSTTTSTEAPDSEDREENSISTTTDDEFVQVPTGISTNYNSSILFVLILLLTMFAN